MHTHVPTVCRRDTPGTIPRVPGKNDAEVRDRTGASGCGQVERRGARDISQKSNKVLADLGPEIRWLQSYVTDDKLYCVYVAPDEDIIFEHARCGGFPADRVTRIATIIDPSTGD